MWAVIMMTGNGSLREPSSLHELETIHSGHMNVGNHANEPTKIILCQKVFCGREGPGIISK